MLTTFTLAAHNSSTIMKSLMLEEHKQPLILLLVTLSKLETSKKESKKNYNLPLHRYFPMYENENVLADGTAYFVQANVNRKQFFSSTVNGNHKAMDFPQAFYIIFIKLAFLCYDQCVPFLLWPSFFVSGLLVYESNCLASKAPTNIKCNLHK